MSSLYLLSAVVGYLLGSIPVGYLVGRSRGIDIREHGSGNIGATNVVRVLGKKPGYFVFFCDALKGLLAVCLSQFLVSSLIHAAIIHGTFDHASDLHASQIQAAAQAPLDPQLVRLIDFEKAPVIFGILAALCCILGHNFPVWLRFRGGKGVATTVGVLLGLMPAAIGISAVIWAASFYASRYVSLASLLGAAALPITVWFLTTRHGNPGLNNPLFWFSLAAALLIFWRHRANIQRLLHGTETRFGRKTSPTPPPT